MRRPDSPFCPIPGMGYSIRERCNYWDEDQEECTATCFDSPDQKRGWGLSPECPATGPEGREVYRRGPFGSGLHLIWGRALFLHLREFPVPPLFIQRLPSAAPGRSNFHLIPVHQDRSGGEAHQVQGLVADDL